MAAEARARGIHFLGAPVTGSKEQAVQAKLVFWIGGEAAIWKHAGLYCNAWVTGLSIAAGKAWEPR